MSFQRTPFDRAAGPALPVPPLVRAIALVLTLIGVLPVAADVVINELLASNVNAAFDDDGESSDWLELLNLGGGPIGLAGYALSDDPEQPGKWVFPGGTLEPGQHLVVWCSGKDRAHVNPDVAVDDPRYPFEATLVSLDSE